MPSAVAKFFFRPPKVPKPLPELAHLPGVHRAALPIQTRHQVCNPAVLREADGSYLCIVRGANYNLSKGFRYYYGSRRISTADSQAYLMRLSPQFEVLGVTFVEDRHLRANEAALDGIEDYRLFRWQGALWVIGSCRNASTDRNVMMMARLEGHVLVDAVFMPSPLAAPIEKNWAPLVVDGDLHFLYSHDPLRVMRYRKGGLEEVFCRPAPELARCSGGSCAMPLPNGGWRSVIHRYQQVRDVRWRVYEHLIADYAEDFSLRRVSRPFRFQFDGVEFCAGLSIEEQSIVLSYGVLDNQALLLRLSHDQIEALF